MLKSKKVELVAELQDVFNNHELVVIFHYKGLSVDEMEDLRSKIYDTNSGFKVVKNKLAAIASKETSVSVASDLFVGPVAIAWSKDPVAVPKILVDFAKNHEHIKIVGGAYGDKKLDTTDVVKLAKMPSLDGVRAQVISVLQTPASQLAMLFKASGSSLARVVGAYASKG